MCLGCKGQPAPLCAPSPLSDEKLRAIDGRNQVRGGPRGGGSWPSSEGMGRARGFVRTVSPDRPRLSRKRVRGQLSKGKPVDRRSRHALSSRRAARSSRLGAASLWSAAHGDSKKEYGAEVNVRANPRCRPGTRGSRRRGGEKTPRGRGDRRFPPLRGASERRPRDHGNRAAPSFTRNCVMLFQMRWNLAVRPSRHSRSAASFASRRAAFAAARRSSVRLLVLRRAPGGFAFKLYPPVRWAIRGRDAPMGRAGPSAAEQMVNVLGLSARYLLLVASWRLPNPWWLISLVSFVALIRVQQATHPLNERPSLGRGFSPEGRSTGVADV